MEAAPPRDTATRIADARRRLHEDDDAWLATAGPDGPWLLPLSPILGGDTRLWFPTGDPSRTTRNVRANPAVRVAFGHTRDVVMIDGIAEVVPIARVPAEVASSYGERHSSDITTWAEAVVAVELRRVQAWREENELANRTIMRDGRWLA